MTTKKPVKTLAELRNAHKPLARPEAYGAASEIEPPIERSAENADMPKKRRRTRRSKVQFNTRLTLSQRAQLEDFADAHGMDMSDVIALGLSIVFSLNRDEITKAKAHMLQQHTQLGDRA